MPRKEQLDILPSAIRQEQQHYQRRLLRTIYRFQIYLRLAHLRPVGSDYRHRLLDLQSNSGHQIHWCQVLPLNLRTRTAGERPPRSVQGGRDEGGDLGLFYRGYMLYIALALFERRTV